MQQLDEQKGMTQACRDYDRVRQALEFMTGHWRAQPGIELIADQVGLSASQFNALFRRWAGLTPKAFLQALTLDHARELLRRDVSILDASFEVGLSGPSRLHDLFVTHEAMTPGEFKSGGEGLELRYGFHPSPFGEAAVVANSRGLVAIGFVDAGGRAAALADLQRRWPFAAMREQPEFTQNFAHQAFDLHLRNPERPLKVFFIGSDFEVRVWETLLGVPLGHTTTYGAIAEHIDKPKAARAVGAAVGRNPISFVVPCHRVLGKSGALTGYHWGLTRKQAMIGWEAGHVAQG